jgi:hypothetical protein
MSETTTQMDIKLVMVAGVKMIGFFTKDLTEVVSLEGAKAVIKKIEYELALAEDS